MARGQCSEVPTRIAEWLYLGGHLGSDDSWQRWFQFDGRAVTHIVNCAAGEVRYPTPDHVSVLNLNAKDNATYALFAHWPEVSTFVRGASVVLFQCQAGVNRSASLALAAYAVRESKPLLPSVREMITKRPGILKNRHFNRSLVKCLRDEGQLHALGLGEGLLGSAEDVEVLRHEVAAYEQQVHAVFELISQDGYADWALFRQALNLGDRPLGADGDVLRQASHARTKRSAQRGLRGALVSHGPRRAAALPKAPLCDSGSGDDDQGSDAPARRRRRSAKMDFETEQEQLTKKLLPQLVRFATEDQRALQDAAELLTFFVQRHFPDNKELADLAQKPSPEKLLKGLLGVLEKELEPRPGGGKDEKASDQEDEREERDRGDREASPEKERRYREERDGRHRDDRERDGRDRGRDGGRDMRDGRDGRGRNDRRGDDRGRFEERRGERDRGGRPGDPRGGDRRGGGGGRGERRGDDRGGRDRPGDHGGHRDHRRDHGDPRGKGDGRARGRSRSRDARR
eukprot:s1478_g2.t1